MSAFLVAQEGPLAGTTIRLDDGEEWIIGRDPDVSFQVLEDPMVSRKHLICRLDEEGYIVENLSSTNPALVNGNPITDPVTLQDGDILQIGSSLFKFTETDPAEASDDDLADDHPTMFEDDSPLESFTVKDTENANWHLKVISGPNTGAEFSLEEGKTYIIGKDPTSCDIVFQDLSVSRQHADLSLENNVPHIVDLDSRNGILVNSRTIGEDKELQSQDLISLGTTSFLILDQSQSQETLYSPSTSIEPEEEEAEKEEATAGEKKSWKDIFIPTRHLVIGGAFAVFILIGIFSVLTLFKTSSVDLVQKDEAKEIKEILSGFEGVEYTYDQNTQKLFILGDVLTSVDHQEMTYLLRSLPYVRSIEDNVTIDEVVWSDMNALFLRNPKWRGVSMTSYTPGKFVLRGYVQSLQEGAELIEYVNLNFPFNDKLENRVVVENTLETEIQSILIESGFATVTFQLSNGELILAGRVSKNQEATFMETTKELRKLDGVRTLKNFVIITTATTARIDLSGKYTVTGTSKYGNVNQYVVINGQILTTGDTLHGMTITGIESNEVYLEKDGLKYEIHYNQQ